MKSDTSWRYQWPSSRVIARVDTRAHGPDEIVAYLYAAPDITDAAQLKHVRQQLLAQGWASSPVRQDGQFALRVTGIPNDQTLLDLLRTQRLVEGEPNRTSRAAPSPRGLDAIRAQSLRSSAMFYALGDLLFLVSGVMRSREKGKTDYGQIGTGASFLTGDVLLSVFGGHNESRQLKSLLGDLKHHLQEKGVAIPDASTLTAETTAKPGGFLETIFDFMHTHINTIKIMAEILGGAAYVKAGMTQNNDEKKIAGAVIVTGWLGALLVKEKKTDPQALAFASPGEKIMAKIQEKPLQLAGGAGLIHNAISTYGAFKERNRYLHPERHTDTGSKNYAWDLAGISAMLLGNSLYAISNKSPGGAIRKDALIEEVYSIAAQVLHSQPEQVREAAIEATAAYLGERTELKDHRPQIAARLRQEIAALTQNPWYDSSYSRIAPSPALASAAR